MGLFEVAENAFCFSDNEDRARLMKRHFCAKILVDVDGLVKKLSREGSQRISSLRSSAKQGDSSEEPDPGSAEGHAHQI